MELTWFDVISELLGDGQPGVVGVGGQTPKGRNYTFAITPQYSFAQALAKALRGHGISATTFKIPQDGGEVITISGLAVLLDEAAPSESSDTSD